MIDFEERKENISLGGGYTLDRRMQEDGAGAWFTAFSAAGERALAQLTRADAPEAEGRSQAWQRALGLRHTHLIEVRDTGRTELAGVGYVYGVFEYPDEVLAAALGQGAFGEPETRAVLTAVLSALRCLHARGMVHGAVDAEHVFAVGETVKLASDGLRLSEDRQAQVEDLRQLGELVRALRAPEGLSEDLTATLREAQAAYDPPLVAPPQPAAPVLTPPVEMPAKRSIPKWIFVGLGVVLLSILLLHRRPRPEAVPAPPAATAPAPVAPSPTPAAALASRSASRTIPPPAGAGPATWRVIAFTYRSREMAEKKAREVNSRWPEMHAVVFMPAKAPGYYLVALGNRMTRQDALDLQRKARGLGLPRDSYIQNYSE